MKFYIANTFSPMMVTKGAAIVKEVSLVDIKDYISKNDVESIVSHEVTASILSALLGQKIVFNRVNVALEYDDILLCVIPAFRATEAREFSFEEVSNAGFRCFTVKIDDEGCYWL
jgi:hypothetical protein